MGGLPESSLPIYQFPPRNPLRLLPIRGNECLTTPICMYFPSRVEMMNLPTPIWVCLLVVFLFDEGINCDLEWVGLGLGRRLFPHLGS